MTASSWSTIRAGRGPAARSVCPAVVRRKQITSGFADINGALVLQQEDFLSFGISLLALQSMTEMYPDLGLTVDGNLMALEIELGIGNRYDLVLLPGAGLLPNQPPESGLASYDSASGKSILVLPITATLPDLGIPEEMLDLDFTLSGQLAGTATVPEPSSLALTAFAVLAMLAAGCYYLAIGYRP